MVLIVWLQALEPRALFRLGFVVISWCGDGPLYFLLFPLLYWRKSPAMAIRYGYVVGLAALLLTVVKAQTTTLRPFLAAPDQIAFLPYPLAGFSWFPIRDTLIDAYRHDPSFPSGHDLFATAVGLYLYAHTASVWGRAMLQSRAGAWPAGPSFRTTTWRTPRDCVPRPCGQICRLKNR
jgi:hypothetical protein